MKYVVIATVFALVFGPAAVAQTTPGNPATPQGTNPSAQPQTSPPPSPDMSSSGNQSAATETKGEKKLKGCIESEGGKYVLEDKHGKEVALSGSADFAAHVGHTVTVHGTFGSDASGAASATSTSGTSASAEKQFMVSKLDMVSETCKKEKDSDKGKNKEKESDSNYSKPNPNHK